MKKIFYVFSMIALFFLVGSFVFASPPATSPKCYIEGTVQSVEFKDAYDEPCLKEENGCPTDMELRHPARYFLAIKINTISYVSGDANFVTCENMLPLNTEKTIYINKDEVKTGDSFELGQKIKGQVSSFWGISFYLYELEKSTTDDQEIEQEDTDVKTGVYIAVATTIIVGLLLVIYFLRKNQK